MAANGRRSWERTSLILIAVVAVAVMIFAFRLEKKLLNQRMMYYQLQSIRKSIDLFRAVEGKNPASLQELASTEFSFAGEDQKHRFLESPTMNERGLFLDAFGSLFEYDPASGRVKSSTRGYEFW